MKLLLLALILIVVPRFNEQPKPQPKPLQKAPNPNKPIIIRIRYRTRELVRPEQLGLKANMPFACSKKQLEFECLCCGVKAWTHWVHPHYPQCSKCKAVMIENLK